MTRTQPRRRALPSLALAVACILATASAVRPGDPQERRDPREHQFDFWLGEWSVNNRFLRQDGTWVDGGTSRARITPVAGGSAVFEEWSGELAGRGRTIGISLRAFDPAREEWVLLLNWPGGNGSSFGTLAGRFRHGRGEFFAGGGASRTRYTFSDALPDTMRWDSARTTDGGRSWATDWIMEFSRTAPAAAGDDALFEVDWDDVRTAPPACRGLDFLSGDWTGVQELTADDGSVTERPARLSAAVILRGWVVVSSLEVGDPEAPDEVRFRVSGHVTRTGAFESWTVSRDDTRLVRSVGEGGEAGEGRASFARSGPGAPPGATPVARTLLVLEDEDRLAIEELERGDDGGWTLRARTRLERLPEGSGPAD